ENEGVAAQVLMNLGVRSTVLREEVLNLVYGVDSPRESLWQDEEAAESTEVPNPEIQHLPESAREIVAEFDCQIDVVKEEKEQAVGAQAWEKAAHLRVLEHKLKRLRDEFISHWPKS